MAYQIEEGFISVTGGKIYYKKVGSGSKTPLIVLHGGPGGTHVKMKPLEALADERSVIFYDQLGSGRSDRPNDKSLWVKERFVEELGQIREALGLTELHILGHSWGTMLAASYLLNKPKGIKSVIFSSPCLSAPKWAEDQDEHRKELPIQIQEILLKCEQEGTTSSEEYKEAMKEFYKRFVYRLDYRAEEWDAPYAQSNPEVYETMWGPSEFYTTGNLKTFDVTPQLHEINIPALFTCGRYDEATPKTVEAQSKLIEGARFHVFENSSHTTYIEDEKEYIQVVSDFLRSNEN